jgi:hypothetical protein
MPTPLPDHPNLDQLKNQAKDLLKGQKAGDPETLARIQVNHPRLGASSVHEIRASRFTGCRGDRPSCGARDRTILGSALR